MLKERDRKILSFVESAGSITISQCGDLFFNGSYEGARRRLSQLEKEYNKIKNYKLKETGEKVYYISKKNSYHDVLRIDYLSKLKTLGCEILEIDWKPRYMKGKIIPDLFVVFQKGSQIYFTLLEVDLYHQTSLSKMQRYEELFKSDELQEKYYGVFPIIVISRILHNGLRYNSNNFKIIYTDVNYNSLENFLF